MKAEFRSDLTSSKIVHQPNKLGININKGEPVHKIELINTDIFNVKNVNERQTLNTIIGEDVENTFWINSFHHQGIGYNPIGFPYKENNINILAVADTDNSKNNIKIIELMSGESWISCQWHPEWDYEVNSVSKQVVDTFKKMLK